MEVVKPWKKMHARASLVLSLFDTVDSRFFKPSRETWSKKSIVGEIGDKRIVFR